MTPFDYWKGEREVGRGYINITHQSRVMKLTTCGSEKVRPRIVIIFVQGETREGGGKKKDFYTFIQLGEKRRMTQFPNTGRKGGGRRKALAMVHRRNVRKR